MARNAGFASSATHGRRRCSTRIDHVVHETRNNTGLTVLMAFNYGRPRRADRAFRSLARQVLAGELKPEEISEEDQRVSLHRGTSPIATC